MGGRNAADGLNTTMIVPVILDSDGFDPPSELGERSTRPALEMTWM
jgi:hypothetical protein